MRAEIADCVAKSVWPSFSIVCLERKSADRRKYSNLDFVNLLRNVTFNLKGGIVKNLCKQIIICLIIFLLSYLILSLCILDNRQI